MAKFNLEKFIADVFAPVREDVVMFMIDLPHDDIKDDKMWGKRRTMAEEWRQTFIKLSKKYGYKVKPLLQYKATGGNSAPLPIDGTMDGRKINIEEELAGSTLVVAMTEFSATGPLDTFTQKYTKLRCASMPKVAKEMEETALSADYDKIAKMCDQLSNVLNGAVGSDVIFSTGHNCYFDLRFRKAELDDGRLPPNKKGERLINLPSGEVYIAPYEGEKPGEPSKTNGELAAEVDGEIVVFKVKDNKIVEVTGKSQPVVKKMNDYFKVDDARRNIAELGLGCNDKAIRRNIILEDEKAGFHWAYGRSDHVGGVVGVSHFKDLKNVVHTDLIYAKGSKVGVNSIILHYADGKSRNVWDGNWYKV